MGSLKRAEILGTMGADPEVKQLQGGNKVAQFTLATNDPAHKLQNGTEVPEKTEWHNIVCWGNLATIAERFLRKGAQVYVDGKLRTRSYDDKQGVKRYTTEIVANNIVLLNNGRNSRRAHNSLQVEQLHNKHNKVRHRQRKVAHTVQKMMICHSKTCWSV